MDTAAILRVQHWLQARGVGPVAVPAMASEAGMEERTFQRRFKAATGMTPVEYVQHLRVGKARELLEFDGAGMVTLDILPDAAAVPLLNPALLTHDLVPIYGRGADAKPMVRPVP